MLWIYKSDFKNLSKIIIFVETLANCIDFLSDVGVLFYFLNIRWEL